MKLPREKPCNFVFVVRTNKRRVPLDEVEPEVTKEPLFKLLKRQEGIKVFTELIHICKKPYKTRRKCQMDKYKANIDREKKKANSKENTKLENKIE